MDLSLTDWLEDPSPSRGLYFADERDGWDLHTYADLALAIGGAALEIEEARSAPGRPVMIVLPTGPDFVAAFLGAILAGDTACPLAPPGPIQTEDYARYLAGILHAAQPSLIVTDSRLEGVVKDAVTFAGMYVPLLELEHERADPIPRPPAELALLQFTSGSTGRPRGVRITPDNLQANMGIIGQWLGGNREEAGVSWLPLFHDMGLIGALLTPIGINGSMYLMRPGQFVRRPARWLQCIAEFGAQYTAAPPFGFALTRRRVKDADLEGWDFSNWRVAAVAAERLDAPVLASFGEWLAPYGFRPDTFRPAYGLAENTLAVTGTPPRVTPPVVHIASQSLVPGRPVQVKESGSLAPGESLGRGAGWLVGSGIPHPGVEVEIRSEDGTPLPDGHLGEIHVGGPSVAHGYGGDDAGGSTRFDADGVRTGDAGFMIEGELYVVGRMGDSLKVHGRSVYMEDLEAEIRTVPGIRKGQVAAVAGVGPEGSVVCALVEARAGDWVQDVGEAMQRATAGAHTVRVYAAKRGTILRTSSGKPRRRPMWAALADGSLRPELALELPARVPLVPREETGVAAVGAVPEQARA